ncbi:MAG: hypothetical protein P1P65_05690 [Treponema sp.]
MKKRTAVLYTVICVYEILKVLYIASFASVLMHEMLFFKYISLSALCVPVLPWFMLALNERDFYWALYAEALFKFSAICAEFLYIFHGGFAIITAVFTAAQQGRTFIKEVIFFLAVDTVLLSYSFMRGSVYYANNTDC